MSHKLKPKLLSVLKTYTKEQLVKDIIAGLIVAIIALPLSIGLAISSGATPEVGLYTAIVAGFFISLLGGSRVQIGGPSATFMIVLYSVISTHGLEAMMLTTILAGIILVLFGLFKFGSTIKYIPYPITIGFTSGIAVTIFSSQINDFLGLNLSDIPAEFTNKWALYFSAIPQTHINTMLVGLLALAILIGWPRINKQVPGSLIAIIATTVLVYFFDLEVLTIGAMYPDLSASLPPFKIPEITFEKVAVLIEPAFTIAFLCSVESLLSAVVSDGMIGSRHRSNMELVAEGVANIASGLFGGMPATGAIARTVANVKNGGRTPIAGIVHAIVLLLILVFFMPLVKLIPLPTLAAILIIVSYNMSEWRTFTYLLKAPKSDVAVLLATFFLTVFFDLALAISVGMVLASILFMKRMTDVMDVHDVLDRNEDGDDDELLNPLVGRVLVYDVSGPFFFGAADKLLNSIENLEGDSKVLILKMKHASIIDATGIRALRMMHENASKHETQLILSQANEAVLRVMNQTGFTEELGSQYICETYEQALERAKTFE